MNILVINGSPKGENSITLQTVRYLELLHPEHVFHVLHAGQRIKSLEKDMAPALDALKDADLLIFSYPVYTFIAPWQLHRFIELIKESGVSLAGKCATQITTSKHFYDVTAHRYIEENCADLNLRYIRGLSADMDDLTCQKGQKEAQSFFDYVLFSMQNSLFDAPPVFLSASDRALSRKPVAAAPAAVQEKTGDIAIVTNCEKDDERLAAMIAAFQSAMPRRTRVINIAQYPFRGGCLGCFNCAVSGKCVYTDGFDDYLRSEIQTAESIVYAFTIKDHSMGASFKLYDDRQFCNGHRTVTMGMPMGYIICGDYRSEPNLQMIVEARAQVGGNFLAGVATDEDDPAESIRRLAVSLEYALSRTYAPPQNFYGVGGMKIFRDLIWIMQGMMKADHKFYKAHNQYDFPQKQFGRMLFMYLVGAMLASPSLKKKAGGKMTDGMLMPYKKVLNQVRVQAGQRRAK